MRLGFFCRPNDSLAKVRRLDLDISVCLSGRFLSRHRQLTDRARPFFGERAPHVIDGRISVPDFLVAIPHCLVVGLVKASFPKEALFLSPRILDSLAHLSEYASKYLRSLVWTSSKKALVFPSAST